MSETFIVSEDTRNKIRKDQESHFRELYRQHRGTPMAVSSESPAHKDKRYSEIAGIFANRPSFTVHDVGMGLADFKAFLDRGFADRAITYSGSDILQEYVEEAGRRYPESQFLVRDLSMAAGDDRYDYVTLSGVFHQRRNSSIPEWEAFAQQLLENCFAMCERGLAFNFISPFVDFHQTEVYYCNLHKLIEFIPARLSRFFTIKHDYALYEFTVHVYREQEIARRDDRPEFKKYFKSPCFCEPGKPSG